MPTKSQSNLKLQLEKDKKNKTIALLIFNQLLSNILFAPVNVIAYICNIFGYLIAYIIAWIFDCLFAFA